MEMGIPKSPIMRRAWAKRGQRSQQTHPGLWGPSTHYVGQEDAQHAEAQVCSPAWQGLLSNGAEKPHPLLAMASNPKTKINDPLVLLSSVSVPRLWPR